MLKTNAKIITFRWQKSYRTVLFWQSDGIKELDILQR